MKVGHLTLASALVSAGLLLAACGGDSSETLLKSARGYIEKNDNSAAVIQLKNALQQKPELAEARFLLGKALLAVGDAPSATVELRKALDLNYPAVLVLPVLARSLVEERQYQKLIEQYAETILTDAAAAADLKTSIALAYSALAAPEKAQAALNVALQLAPDSPAGLLLKAKFAADARKYDEALAVVEKVIAAAPNDPQGWQYKGDVLLLGKGDLAGAGAAYRKALSIRPDYVPARSNLISLLVSQRDLKAAADQLAELRKVQPKGAQTLYFEAQLAFLNKEGKKAHELVQQLLKIAPDSVQVLQLAGAVSLGEGELLDAERSLTRALAASPNLPDTRRRLARTLLRLGQPARALDALAPLLAGAGADAQTYALAAEAHMQAGNPVQAQASYAKAAKVDPKDAKSRTALALSRFKAGGSEAVVADLQDIAADDKGALADLALVNVYMQSKDYERALKAIDAIDAKQPKKATTADLRGRVYLLQKNIPEARRNFELALTLDPAYIPAAAGLASLDLADKKPDAARKRFDAVLAVDPKNLTALLAVASLQTQKGAPKEEVAGLLANAAKLNPTDSGPRLLLIEYHIANKDLKLAMTAAQDAVAALPENAEVLDALGRVQVASGDTNQALATFNRLTSLNAKSSLPYMRLASVYMSKKQIPEAENSLRRALAITPDLLDAQNALIEIALANNRMQEAKSLARAVLQQRPNSPVGLMLQGRIDVFEKNFKAAVDTYRRAVAKFPNTESSSKLHSVLLASGQHAEADKLAESWLTQHPKDAEFLAYIGESALGSQNYAAAEKYFRDFVSLRPSNWLAMNNVAWAMFKQNKPGAAAYAEQAVKLHPKEPALMDTWASALAAEKQFDKALQVQKQALEMSPTTPMLRLDLAKLYIQTGDKVAARTELETLKKLGDRVIFQKEVEQLLKAL